MTRLFVITLLTIASLQANAQAIEFDAIHNMGLNVWSIVKKGRAVVNVKSKSASALPQGIRHWTQMQGWRTAWLSSGIQIDQRIGGIVIDLKYRIMFTYNGSVNGVGKYIGYATVDPEVNAKWLAPRLDVWVSVPTIFNMGTTRNPIAAMKIDVHIRTKRLQVYETVDSFIITGNGKVHQL